MDMFTSAPLAPLAPPPAEVTEVQPPIAIPVQEMKTETAVAAATEELKPAEIPAPPVVETAESQEKKAKPADEEDEDEDGATKTDDEQEKADDDEDETAEGKDKAADAAKKPRQPYEWGKCDLTIITRIRASENGIQRVTISTATHDNPTEPPVIANFTVPELPMAIGDEFVNKFRETLAGQAAQIVKGLPDRETTWKLNPAKANPETPSYRKPVPTTVPGRSGSKKAAGAEKSKTPPALPQATTMPLFGNAAGGSNAK